MVAKYVGVAGAVAFDSDSSAYETALHYFGVAGGEVVVCTNSFVSVPNSVVAVGGKVVFADIRSRHPLHGSREFKAETFHPKHAE